MVALTIEARFPMGEFNAHGADGGPEWPPAPARLLSALLAAAHRGAVGIAQVESLFSLAPPVVTTPASGARDVGFRRWVPANDNVDLSDDDPCWDVSPTYSFMENVSKAPERGTLVGTGQDDVVRWVFPDHGPVGEDDMRILQEVASRVEYLGRPTSPVVLTVVRGEAEAPADHERWEPDSHGPVELRVGSPELLRALNDREEQRRRSRFTGAHPSLAVRPTARYQWDGAVAGDVVVPRLARRLLEGAVLYRVREAHVLAADAPLVLGQVRDALGRVEWMLPVLGADGRGRDRLQVLRAVLVRGGERASVLSVATRGGVARMGAAEPGSMTSLPRVMRALCSGGERWTTLVPTDVDRDRLEEAVIAAAARSGCRVLEAVLHDDPVGEIGVPADELGTSRHVTMVVKGSPSTPLVLGDVMMMPVGAAVAVNPRRPSG
ncbi:type I-U CRISPR-associated protein Csb2 [Actinomyces marmotae]|nr:type I-U CRISPR-associated protein Csb2 [Actinomyces marmotae]